MPLTPEQSGKGRTAIGRNPVALVQIDPEFPDVRAPATLFIDRDPGEFAVQDLFENRARRLGRIHDDAELEAGTVAASNCRNATLFATVAEDAKGLAIIRSDRGALRDQGGPILGPGWRLDTTDKALRLAGGRAGLRLRDLRDDPAQPSLQRLHAAGQRPASTEWIAYESERTRTATIGAYVRNERGDGESMILNIHALGTVYDAGLVSITPVGESPFSPEELHGRPTALQRFQKINNNVTGWIKELEISGQLVVRLVAVGLGVLGALRVFGIG